MKRTTYARVYLTGFFLSLTSLTTAYPSAQSIYTDSDEARLKEVQQLLNRDIHCTPHLSASQIVAYLRSEERINNHIDYLVQQKLFGTNAKLTYNEEDVIEKLAALGYQKPLFAYLQDIFNEMDTYTPPAPEKKEFAHKHIERILAAQDPSTPALNALCFKMKYNGIKKGYFGYDTPKTVSKEPVGSDSTAQTVRNFVLNPFFLGNGLTLEGSAEATRLWLKYADEEQKAQLFAWAEDPQYPLSEASRHILLDAILERKGWPIPSLANPDNAEEMFLAKLSKLPNDDMCLFAAKKQYAYFQPDPISHKKEFLHLVKTDALRDNLPKLTKWATEQLLALKGTPTPKHPHDVAVERRSDLIVGFQSIKDQLARSPGLQTPQETKQKLCLFLEPHCLDPVICSIAIDRYLDLLSPSELQTESSNPGSFLSKLLNSADESISLAAYTKLFTTLKSKVIVDNGKFLASFKKFGKKLQLNDPETDEEQIAEKYGAAFTQIGIELLGKMAQSKHAKVALWAIDHRIFGRMSNKQGFPVGLDQNDPKLMDTFITLLTKWHQEDLAGKKS